MKKLVLLSLAISFGTTAGLNAQTPEKKSIALFNKLTSVGCYYCGEWGWDLANDVTTATEGKSLFMGVYVAFGSSNAFMNPTATAFNTPFASPGWGGIPDFGVNGIGITSSSASTATFVDAVNTFAATTPIASPANKMTISGNTVTATAKAQFWSATTGEYYLAAYLIEDGPMSTQAGPIGASGQVAHHDVLRGSMSADKPWGEQIVNGAVTANQTFNKTFTFNVTDAQWNKSKMTVYTILWKKNGTKFEYVNGSKSEAGSGTSIDNIAGVQDINIYPNPASGNATIYINASENKSISISVSDMLGRSVYASENNKLAKGVNNIEIPLSNFVSGSYNVTVTSGTGKVTKRLAVIK